MSVSALAQGITATANPITIGGLMGLIHIEENAPALAPLGDSPTKLAALMVTPPLVSSIVQELPNLIEGAQSAATFLGSIGGETGIAVGAQCLGYIIGMLPLFLSSFLPISTIFFLGALIRMGATFGMTYYATDLHFGG